ncbi:heme lyase CcmF/NrfE family subunit [Sutterella sp.]|uniref:heme lyase CcmF/NrfE family subunit n=1 Tax=Sutterella sp. TaxID=1981025 RepID=UPI0026DFCDED|nr:heme lyase CcmF/NrfE family subunit [Sutterella sp.]MDO5532140.1 heme lyase CcmF/NrfE family subunit [Sutterella sp.]
MTAEIGHFALVVALVISALGGVLTLAGAQTDLRSWMRTGPAAAVSLALTGTIAIGALAYGFVTSDFSILNVARNSNDALPWEYKLAAVWGSHEGSILFWVSTLTWWILAVAISARRLPEKVLARILGTLFLVAFGLYLFILTTSNPFLRLFPPAEQGADLNPLLQDPGMIFHPPLLYLGYVGFAVPFAFAVAALLGGRLDVAWARWMRPWTTVSWVLLTLGISLGSYWSYYELGWGGWWAWDPVENSSFMPWLTGTALMHSLAVTEKRGAFKIWTVFLAILTFSLSLLGTFLVRSGVLTSVHAFASDPTRGMFILIFLSIVIGISFLLFAWRASSVGTVSTFSWCSRESLLMSNNLLLVVGMAIVLLGTLYPLFLDAVGGGKITVGGPYFDSVFGSSMVPLSLILPMGAVCAWRQHDPAKLGRFLAPAFILAVVAGIATPFILGRWDWVTALGAFLAWWILFGAITDWVRYARTARAQKRSVFGQTLPWWGMHLAHIGLAMLILGAVTVTEFQVERNVTMNPGDQVTVRDVTFRYNGWVEYRGPNYTAAKGSISVLDAATGSEIQLLEPEKRNYDSVTNMSMTEAAIMHRPHEDVYVSLATPTTDGNGWVVRAYVKPLVLLIWIGTLFMSLGGLLACLERRRKTRED